MVFAGTYFDGKRSQAAQVRVYVEGDMLRVADPLGAQLAAVPLRRCIIAPALGNTRRGIHLPDGAKVETDDFPAVAELERLTDRNMYMRLVDSLERRWKSVLAVIIILTACTWAFTAHGLPALARMTAAVIPMKAMDLLSAQTLEFIDQRFLKPSRLPRKKASEVQSLFKRVAGDMGTEYDYRLMLREGGPISANALALPSGTIIMTDELVGLAGGDLEIAAVMAHEMSHVRRRHAMRSILQEAGVFLLISILVGDVTSITSMAASLPTLLVQTGYSRQFEKEADKDAGLYLMRTSGSTKPLQDILARLARQVPHGEGPTLLSTHPGTDERIARLKAMESAGTGH